MLTADQRHELTATGITYLRGAVARDVVDDMHDRIWEMYAEKGVFRDDATTWPHDAFFQTKLQRMRKTGMFKPFGTPELEGIATQLLGDWHELDPWGAPLITFPHSPPWVLPKKLWHFDYRAQGRPDPPMLLRMFAFVSDVGPRGGGTLVVEGSHELVRRRVASANNNDAGSSKIMKKRLAEEFAFFRAPSEEPAECDGVRVRVAELTGQPGDIALMLPWTMHNISMNCSDQPRFMVTHTYVASGHAFPQSP